MKVVIFAGGIGARITEESHLKPKPMIEIGNKPILWHIMKIYESQGFNEFIICLGYKGHIIKEYFVNYFIHNSDLTIDLNTNSVKIHHTNTDNFKVTLVDTGFETGTAGRLKKIAHLIDEPNFMLTYGDGLSDINLKSLIKFHLQHGKIATLTTVQPRERYGNLLFNSTGLVTNFCEKPESNDFWINGGFFVINKKVFEILQMIDETVMWEHEPLYKLTKNNQLMAFQHLGFWKCMDSMRDKIDLENLWNSGKAKWKIWK